MIQPAVASGETALFLPPAPPQSFSKNRPHTLKNAASKAMQPCSSNGAPAGTGETDDEYSRDLLERPLPRRHGACCKRTQGFSWRR